ncbi:MAG: glycosyltransferase family 4 protein [Hyphomicrobium sp.]|nr:glycosyltransferase family 4 protein [Hyphomicrobium sp.]
MAAANQSPYGDRIFRSGRRSGTVAEIVSAAATTRLLRERGVRILIVHNRYQQPGGEDAVVSNESVLLAGHGHDVRMHVVSNDEIKGFGDKVSALRHCAYSIGSRNSLAERLASEKPDIVHVHNVFPLLTPSVYDACRAHRVPVVQTLHNYRIMCANGLLMRNGSPCRVCVDGTPYQGALHACYRGSYVGSAAVAHMIDRHRREGTWLAKVDRYIALSNFSRAEFVAAGLPKELVSVKGNVVFDPGPVEARIRRGGLFVGRLSEEKGVRDLIRAWNGLNVPLTIAGDGPLMSEVRAHASSNIRVLGRVDKSAINREMRRAAFLILPSTCFENFPVSVAEAFASGLPAVVARIGALADIVKDHETGLHFEPGDAEALRAAVRWADGHPAQMAEMGRVARATYERELCPEVNYRQLKAIYDAALDGARPIQIEAPSCDVLPEVVAFP